MSKRFARLQYGAFTFGLFASLFVGLLSAWTMPKALAAGETYTWQDYQTIHVSGGQLESAVNLVKPASTIPGQPEQLGGTFIVPYSKYPAGKCQMPISLVLSSNQSGTLSVYTGPSFSAPGSTPTCPSDVYNSYNNSTVSIGGTRPTNGSGTSETDAQKTVWFVAQDPKAPNKSPSSLSLVIKGNGQTKTITLDQKVLDDPKSDYPATATYEGSTQLAPGSYTACPDQLVGCTSFTKTKFKTANVNWGTAYAPLLPLKATLELNFTHPVNDESVGPFTLQLESPDGTVLDTQKTDSVDAPASSDQKQVQGSILVDSTFDLHAIFQNVKPGNYRICLDDGHCTNVTQPQGRIGEVKLTVNGDDAAALAGDTSNTSGSADACVSSNSLGWFLCKIYDGVGDASTWLFKNVVAPWLHEPPISLDPSTSSYQTWSAFRVYGDIFLVIALLVIVFGESIGGGMIDAYTAKKVLPRLLIAAVLINLSLYIVAALVDIANVLGAGIGELITKGLGNGGAFHINLSGAQAGTITGVSASAGIGTILFAILVKGGASILASGIAYVALLIISMVFFGLLAMFITLVVRQAGILVLVLLSPIAFALYCLPNTEQYFKKWWELLLELLMMYPIVVVMLSAADLLSVAVDTNYNGNNPNDLLIRPVISFVLQFLPLFFIPFAFRIASKTIGRLNEAIHGVTMRGHEKVGKGLAQQYKQNTADKSAAMRERAYTSLKGSASKGGFIRRKGLGILAGQVGGYNMDARISAIQAQRAKEINDTIATGKDNEIRGLTVDKSTARSRVQDGKTQYQTLGGAWVDEADVDRGWARWGHDKYAQQAALSYEMRKAQSEEQLQNLGTNYHGLAQAWGMTEDQERGAWIGAAFENQNQHLEYKYVDHATGQLKRRSEDGVLGGGLVDEVYEKRGSYPMAQMSSNTIEQLKVAHADAVDRGDTETQQKIAAIAETFMHEMGTSPQPGEKEGETVYDPATGQPTGRRQASTPGAAHVAERVVELAKETGIYKEGPAGQYTEQRHYNNPDVGNSSTSLNDRQQH